MGLPPSQAMASNPSPIPKVKDCDSGLEAAIQMVRGKTLEECAPQLLMLSSCRLRKLLRRFANAKSD